MRISINQNTASIEEKNEELNELKLLTANCTKSLKELKDRLNLSLSNQSRVINDINLRENLIGKLAIDKNKFNNEADEINERNKLMKRRIKSFKVNISRLVIVFLIIIIYA